MCVANIAKSTVEMLLSHHDTIPIFTPIEITHLQSNCYFAYIKPPEALPADEGADFFMAVDGCRSFCF